MFRRLMVTAKVRESRTITSFHLQPVDSRQWRAFEPGQFLVFKIPAENDHGHVLRNYSISSSPGRTGSYRITVKREAAPLAGVPDGLSSRYLHDNVSVGDELIAEGPRGDFQLDHTSPRPVVLLSGGVGLTPLVSMFHALARKTERRVYFIHACDNGEVHALVDEVRELAALRSGLTLHTCYRFPTAVDLAAGRHDSEGVITAEVLQRVLPLDDYDVYLCGPPPFMQGLYRTLRELGVPKHRIAYEFFGPATVLETPQSGEATSTPPVRAGAPVLAPPAVTTATVPAAAAPTAATPAAAMRAAAMPAQAITVEFRKSGRSVVWEDARSLLDFAEKQGLNPEFSCRAGVCGSCKAALLEGEVVYFQEPLDAPEEGSVLICSCKPKGSIVVDL